jgi:hypothetical protein
VFDASEYWITVVELPAYEKTIEPLLTPEECEGIIAFLAQHPDEGTVLPNTGGVEASAKSSGAVAGVTARALRSCTTFGT